jgi:hypothetical protein
MMCITRDEYTTMKIKNMLNSNEMTNVIKNSNYYNT